MFFSPLLQGAGQLLQVQSGAVSGALVHQVPWTRQPNGVVAVDPAIGSRLALLYRAQTAEQIKPSIVTVEVAAAQTVVRGVVAAGETLVRRYPTTGLQPTTAVTVLAVVALAASSNSNERIFGATEAAVFPYQGYSLQRNSSGQIVFGAGDSSSLITEIVEPTAVLGLHTYIGTFDSANVNLYRDGVLIASTARATGISYTGNGIPVLGGYWNGSSTVTNQYLRGNVVMIGVWSERALPAPLARSLSANPWQIFKPVTRTIALSGAVVQLLRPDGDISSGAWLPSTGSDLFAMLDETTADDGDYIYTTSASTAEVSLTNAGDPAVSTGHIIRYRAKGTGTLTVKLMQGTTTIATHVPTLTTSFQTFTFTLSGAEADSITDYSNLRLQFVSS